MRPPICIICEKDHSTEKEIDLLSFKKSEEDLLFDKRVAEEKIVGHPPYMEWFCKVHSIIANKYTHLTKKEALLKIKAEIDKIN